MAIEKAKELIRAIETDPRTQEALQGLAKPADEDGIIQYCVEAAKLLNCEVTEADIRDAVAALAKERTEQTERAAAGVQGLPDDELAQAAGGGNSYWVPHYKECQSAVGEYSELIVCRYDYVQGHICLENDACRSNSYRYSNFEPKYY